MADSLGAVGGEDSETSVPPAGNGSSMRLAVEALGPTDGEPQREGGTGGPSETPAVDLNVIQLGEEVPAYLEPWRSEEKWVSTDPGEFEARYAAYDLDSVKLARKEHSDEYVRLREEAFQDRIDLGYFMMREFDTEVDLDGDGFADEGLGLPITTSFADPIVRSESIPRSSGPPIARVVWIPPAYYPDIFRLRDEIFWLGQKMRALR